MRKGWKVIGYLVLGVAGAAVLGAGTWFYIAQNVEQPAYRSVEKDGPIEVRDYPALVVAEVTRRGERWGAVNAGFRPLAGYIFAKERPGPRIAMTAPVTQARDEADPGGDWIVRFIMPSEHTLETLPTPVGEDVRLRTVPAARRAAIRFSGVATDDLIERQEEKLRAWLADRGLVPVGTATYAYYNDPFVPGPLRRNEVLFEIEARAEDG